MTPTVHDNFKSNDATKHNTQTRTYQDKIQDSILVMPMARLWSALPAHSVHHHMDSVLVQVCYVLPMKCCKSTYSRRQNKVSVPFALHGERSENGDITVEKTVSKTVVKRYLNRCKNGDKENRSRKNSA